MKKAWTTTIAALFLGMAQGAVWTGNGDGKSWSDAANWGGTLPAAGEAVSVTATAAITIDLGDADRDIGALSVAGATGKVTFSGTGTLRTTGIDAYNATTYACPVAFKTGNNTVCCRKTAEFQKAVTSEGTSKSTTFSTSGNACHINLRSTFTGAGTTIRWSMGSAGATSGACLHFYGKVTAAGLKNESGYKSGWCYLHATGNEIAAVNLMYTSLVLAAKDALPETTVFTWSTYYTESGLNFTSYDCYGCDQTIDRIDSTFVRDNSSGGAKDACRHIRSTAGDMTLTLKGSKDATYRGTLNEGVSLVYDSANGCTQTFIVYTNTTAGAITVKRGTVKVSQGAAFSTATALTIQDGGTFNLDTGVSGALADVSAVDVASGGTLKIGATSADAFANGKATMTLVTGSTFEANADCTVFRLRYNGKMVPVGTYRSATGTGAGTEAAWLTGSGSVTVLDATVYSKVTRTWTGGGDGATWDDDENWDTGAPISEDTAAFTKSATITSAVALDGPRPIDIASGCTVTLTNTLSGADAITKLGAGNLVLKGSNTFTGTLYINNGRVGAYGDCALGDNASGAIDVTKNAVTIADNLVLHGVTLRKTLIIRNVDDANNKYTSSMRSYDHTTNTILGALNVPNQYLRMSIGAGSRFVIAGGGTFATAQFFNTPADAEVVVTNLPINRKIYDCADTGWLTLSSVGNTFNMWGPDHANGQRGLLRTTVNGAFSSNSYFYFGSTAGILDLCGTTQNLARIEAMTKSSTDWTPIAGGTIRSAAPAELTFNGNTTYTNSAIFTGDVSLRQTGTGTLHLIGASTSTGTLTAVSGRIVLAAGATWAGDLATAGGTIALANPGAIDSTRWITLGETGSIELPAGSYAVAGIRNAQGESLPAGSYAATAADGVTALEGLAGEGVLTVLPAASDNVPTYTWTGSGDGRFTSAENWEGNVLPDFDMPGAYVFTQSAYTATVDTNVNAKSLTFTSSEKGSFRFDQDVHSNGLFRLTDGAITVTREGSETKNVAFCVPVEYARNLALRVGDVADTATATVSLLFYDRVSTLGEATLRKDGYGGLYFNGDANVINGDVVVSNGFTYVSGKDPLGGSGLFRMYVSQNDKNTKFILNGAVVNRELWFTHPSDNNEELLRALANTTNYCNGKVTNANSHFRFQARDGSVTHCTAGFETTNFMIPTFEGNATGYFVITNKPANGNRYWADWKSGKCVLAAPNSGFNTPNWNVYNSIELGCDQAIKENQIIAFNTSAGAGSQLDLTGTTQVVAAVTCDVTTNASGVVTKCAPSQVTGVAGSSLTLSGSAAVDVLPPFAGSASYVNAGTAARTLRRPSTSDGALAVAGGTLTLAAPGAAYNGVAQTAAMFPGGSWAGTNVTVTAGTLVLGHAHALASEAVVKLGPNGTLNIPAGASTHVAALYLMGTSGWELQRCGAWGGTDNAGAGRHTGRITGDGVLRVGPLGTLITFR